MVGGDDEGPILTLEPLIEAVRTGVEGKGWELSGLQKTTSHQFEGRWEGDSTRSAYVFFHHPDTDDAFSVDVYLDETSRGLRGNLALVVDLAPLGVLGDSRAVLAALADLSAQHLPSERSTPLTVRLRLDGPDSEPADADTEVRFKLRIPRSMIEAGPAAVRSLCSRTLGGFHGIISAPGLARLLQDT